MFINVGGIMVNTKSVKRAEITIEMAIAIAMSVVVVLLVLKLFGGNISTIVKNSGIGRLLYKDNSIAKTAWADDPTKTQINVQIVADQGSLAQYHNDAAAAIERYETESHTDTLTAENIENLALQLTIYAESGPSGMPPNALLDKTFAKNPSLTYWNFGKKYGILVADSGDRSNTRVAGRAPIRWGSENKSNGKPYNEYAVNNYRIQEDSTISSERSLRVKNIEGIKKCFKEQYKL